MYIYIIMIQEDSISMKAMRTRNQQKVEKSPKQPKKEPKKPIAKKKMQPLSRGQMRKQVMLKFDKMKSLKKGKKKGISSLLVGDCIQEEELGCSICLQLMTHPTTLPCGHTFCIRCIHSLNKTEQKYKCALCRATDYSDFYEIDPLVEKLLKLILERVGQRERKEYESKKGQLLKELTGRAQTLLLKVQDEVKVRVGDTWEMGTIVEMIEMKERRFYWVEILGNQRHLLPAGSINLTSSQSHNLFNSSTRVNSPCLMPAIFREVRMPPPINQGYNIEELLWEVNYYPPAQAGQNMWFQPESVPQIQLEMEESDSVMFLGRNPARNQIEIIEID